MLLSLKRVGEVKVSTRLSQMSSDTTALDIDGQRACYNLVSTRRIPPPRNTLEVRGRALTDAQRWVQALDASFAIQ